jgi:hypothetical protein
MASTTRQRDRLGNQTDILYPDSSEASYTRDASNQVTNVTQREGSSSPWRNIASSITYSPLGQEQTIQWGSGATTTNTYDANNLYRLTHKGFGTITATDDAADYKKQYFHTGNGTDSSHGEYADAQAKIGKVYRTENYDPQLQ